MGASARDGADGGKAGAREQPSGKGGFTCRPFQNRAQPTTILGSSHADGLRAIIEERSDDPGRPARRSPKKADGQSEGLYAHMLQKRAMYGIDPAQRLSLMRRGSRR